MTQTFDPRSDSVCYWVDGAVLLAPVVIRLLGDAQLLAGFRQLLPLPEHHLRTANFEVFGNDRKYKMIVFC
ncbi:MAG: hypothetical protein OER86_01345 [Phycisphaerae bacterium]|nr:hypothetical protein [Phycisphaerae bacterium]